MNTTLRKRILDVGGVALCLGATAAAIAQSGQPDLSSSKFVQIQSPQSGSLAGRLTNLRSAPLAGVTIVLRNQSTGGETRTTTAKNGAFHFASLYAGEYTLDADAANLGHGRLEGILITGGNEARIQAAMDFTPVAPALVEASVPSLSTVAPTASVFAHPRISTSTPPLVASISDEPIRSFRLTASPIPDVIRSPAPPISSTSMPPPIAPPVSALASGHAASAPAPSPAPAVPLRSQLAAHVATLPSRPTLQTESTPAQLALSLKLPNLFPLKSGAAPAPTTVALPSNFLLVKAAVSSSIATAPSPEPPTTSPHSDPVTPAVTTNVSAAQLETLPASGRHWQDFLLSTPTAGTATDSSQPAYRGSQQSAEVTVDGASIGLAFGASAQHASSAGAADPQNSAAEPGNQSWTAGRGIAVSESAVHELTVTAGNVEAEGMRSAGGRAAIRTESGGNALHGQGFFFDRQNTWGAQNPYTKWVQNTGTIASPTFNSVPFTPPDHETVAGLGIGSDILRNKLFWFAALDSNHRNDPGLSTVKNPTEFFIQPEPTSASVTLLSAQLGESQNQAWNDYMGLAASGHAPAGLEQLAALLGPAPRASAQWVSFGRLDWQAAERHKFTLEGIGADQSSPGGGLTRVSEVYGSHSYGSSYASQQWLMARWEAYVTSNLLAVTQASAGRAILSARADTPSSFEQPFLNANSWGQLPQISIDSRYGFTIGNPARFGQGSYPDERLFHAQEMLDWVHGKLLLRAGFELDHNSDAVTQLRNQTGSYSYSTVASFISDALAFQKYGLADALDPKNPHNCGTTNTKWGSQPCYSWYSQTMGPTDWHLSTNDWAGYATAQWQLSSLMVFSVGLRWEREQMPPPIASLANPELTAPTFANPQPPLTAHLPSLGNNWGPRVSLAIGKARDHWPVLRLGYGMYYGRTENSTIETALTQTGSLKGDLNFFMRPSDDCQHCAGGAPPFPYVLSGEPPSLVAPGAVGFAPGFRNPEIHQATAAIEQSLPAHVMVTAAAMLSLGRRLPISVDTNFNPAVNPNTITYAVKDPAGKGPIKAAQITVPFYASWPFEQCPAGAQLNPASQCGRLFGDYQQITQITSRANSTYEAVMIKIARYGRRGLGFHANYTYAHAMDWNPNETTLLAGSDVLDPANFRAEYGTGNFDVRHSASVMAILEAPWKLHGVPGLLADGWALSGIGQFRSGLPYTMRTSGALAEKFDLTGSVIAGLGPGMNASGGDNRVYGQGNDGRFYNIGRNTFRYPNTWKADLRLAKRFDLSEMRQLELMAETFNLFNHQNVTALETTGYSIENSGTSGTMPTLCFLTINTVGNASCGTTPLPGAAAPIAAFGQPRDINATDFFRERQIELGLRMRF
ncbi:MAG TPA: carboxypeptidase regulatory-like domain-containing protein [Terracidiphilus sp.]|nr:carboxypeptidase regulatory-like domain-containing protein [Terracidiphilus sp.]